MKKSNKQINVRHLLTGTLILAAMIFAVNLNAQTYKYDFGTGAAAAGYTKVAPSTVYSSAQGYGFEPGTTITAVSRGGSDLLRGDYCTASSEFAFSVKVPEGNYDVTFILGDTTGTSTTTVKAENRRLLFDRVSTASGQVVNKTITVYKGLTTSVDGKVTMTITSREQGYYSWDEKLTLFFSGSKTAVCGVELVKNDTATTIWLCGDSTVVDQPSDPYGAWGQLIPRCFLPGVAIANYAESGLTGQSFLSMNRLAKLLSDAKAGDYVCVEFGHNDQKVPAEVTAYPTTLTTFYNQIKAKGAIPIFVTPTARKAENDPTTSIGGLAQVMRTTAKSLNALLIDLNSCVIALHKSVSSVDAMYADPTTHFTYYGAFEEARFVSTQMSNLKLTVAQFINPDLSPFDPTKPDPVNYFTTTPTPSSAKTITAFGFTTPAAVGLVNGLTISVTVPTGTNVANLVATFITTGASVKVGSTTQISGTTPNNFSGAVTYTVTAADGTSQNYVVTVTIGGSPVLKGDVNGDGAVNIVDALLIAQYYVGLNPSTFILEAADVNCSGNLDIVDALLVAQYYVGLIAKFPC